MSLFTLERKRLEITDAGTRLLERNGRGGWRQIDGLAHARDAEPLNILRGLQPALDSALRRRERLDIVVPDRWCKIYMTTPPSNVASIQDLRDSAAMRLQRLYDLDLEGHEISADLRVATPFACCAMQRGLVDELRALGGTSKTRVESIQPQYFAQRSRWRPMTRHTNFWFMSCDDMSVTIGMHAHDGLSALLQTRWPATAWSDGQQIAAAVAREALRAGVERPSTIALTGPPVSEQQVTRADGMDIMHVDIAERPPRIDSATMRAPSSKAPA